MCVGRQKTGVDDGGRIEQICSQKFIGKVNAVL
jgi:hypothetical protein